MQKLQDLIRSWHNFGEVTYVIKEWFKTAKKLMDDKSVESQEAVEMHKKFFQHINEDWMRDLISISQDLKASLPEEEHELISNQVETLTSKWKVM